MESRLTQFKRASLEVAFIVFLFYANLLMGEFTRTTDHGQTILRALRDVLTPATFMIAIVSAVLGHFLFESLRRRL
jgi:ABC-type antimicrobial peptide transport system permease subunit